MLGLFKSKKDKIETARKELREIFGDYELPVFPQIITSALQKVRDDDSPASSIADLMSSDPGITVRLLRTVNSAAFALRNEVTNIHHAVSMLGRSQLESMLISMAVRDALPREGRTGYDSKRFWATSARRAATARALTELIDPSTRSEAFTASLLQDVAVPILSHQKGPKYGEILEHWHNSDDDLAQLEHGEFGWHHATVGQWLSCEWDFPDVLTQAIGGHHGLAEEQQGTLPAVRMVATLREVNEEPGIERLVEHAFDGYGIPRDQTLVLIQSSFAEAEEIAQLFG